MKLSVCIATYNHEACIRQCIESAVRQDVPLSYEIVVGEDCSTDGTRAILEELEKKYPDKLRVQFRPKSLGVEQNFIKMISECRSEFVAFLDGGSFWISPEKLRIQACFLDAHPEVAFCFHSTSFIDATGKRSKTVMPLDYPPEVTDISFLLQDSNPAALSAVVARRNLLEGLDDWAFELRLWDWALCMLLATHGKIGFIPEEMSIQRVDQGGAWHLLPPPIKILYMIQMFSHVAPKLPIAAQHVIAKKINRLLDWLSIHMIEGEPDTVRATVQEIDALSSPSLSGVILLTMVEGFRTKYKEQSNEIREMTAKKYESDHLLATARSQPIKLLADLFKFRILSFLARQEFLLRTDIRERFGRSADKRDPNRSQRRAGDRTLIGESRQTKSFGHSGMIRRDSERKTILVVSHEVSRTGAPILALNIAQQFSKRYNVVTLILRNGELLEAIRATSIDVVVARRFHQDGAAYLSVLRDLCRKHTFLFAVVNSLESRGVLQGLRENKVRTVTLIHEFASQAKPKSAISDVFKLSSEIIFSAQVTLENALQVNDLLKSSRLHVLPQGKCVVPTQTRLGADRTEEIAWLKAMLQPPEGQLQPFLVIGAGTVDIRKGVDLFIEVATRVITGPDGGRFRFAWIGSGYDPDHDFRYSVYLRDQIRRAGIQDRMLMLRETPEIETAFALADALFLSSRLDPLPNVVIDALTVGLPVLCFDRATGAAEILAQHGLHAECVANYLDTSDVAQKIRTLAASDETYAAVASRSRDLAATTFDFGAYVDKIEHIALQTPVRSPDLQGADDGLQKIV